ncbi:MAG: putative glycoside hydrolase [Candidatus Azambacteria bacterium]|nr:putative glycoside hydrolase [Candidatus Azambacteria bacterium]
MKLNKGIIIVFVCAFAFGAFFIFEFPAKLSHSILIINNSQIKKVPNKHLNMFPQKGIYSTAWTARAKGINNLIRIADETEINSIVIDAKDNGVYIDGYLKDLIKTLREKNIYTIARIVLFQDGSQINNHPDWYFKKPDGTLWQDNRSWYWLDPSNQETWDYNIDIAKLAIDVGFDEINFDYIRYPAFSKNDNVNFPASAEAPAGKPPETVVKSQVINEFAKYLTSELKNYDPEIKLSVDLFAYNMLRADDLGIGQNFRELYNYFDYISPMIYPSHYISGNFGFENTAEHPYEVVFKTIESGKNLLRDKIASEVGTTTPAFVDPVFEKDLKKLRPWLQDFNIGAIYDGEMIRQEKQAVYDAGLTAGWLLWNPRNVYNESALDK